MIFLRMYSDILTNYTTKELYHSYSGFILIQKLHNLLYPLRYYLFSHDKHIM